MSRNASACWRDDTLIILGRAPVSLAMRVTRTTCASCVPVALFVLEEMCQHNCVLRTPTLLQVQLCSQIACATLDTAAQTGVCACPAGQWKHERGITECSFCSENTHSIESSTEETACLCVASFTGMTGGLAQHALSGSTRLALAPAPKNVHTSCLTPRHCLHRVQV